MKDPPTAPPPYNGMVHLGELEGPAAPPPVGWWKSLYFHRKTNRFVIGAKALRASNIKCLIFP